MATVTETSINTSETAPLLQEQSEILPPPSLDNETG